MYCEKQRDPATGKISQTKVLSDDLSGRCAVITDDICDGGYTFIKIAEQLQAKNVERIVLFATHGIFSKGLDVFDGLIDEVITIPRMSNKRSEMPFLISRNSEKFGTHRASVVDDSLSNCSPLDFFDFSLPL